MEERKYRYSYFASEENFKLICKYCKLLEQINSALKKDCIFITEAIGLDEDKQADVIKAVLRCMRPYMIDCEKYTTSQLYKFLINCVKKSVLTATNSENLDLEKIINNTKSIFATTAIHQAMIEYKKAYNKIMENAYIDITSIIKSKAIYGYDADEICQMSAIRVISKLKDISENYLSVSSRAALLSNMVNCSANDHWRKADRTNNNIDTFEFNIADCNNLEDKIINTMNNHNDTLIILRHALDIAFVDSIDNAVSFTLMIINEALGSKRPLSGEYSLDDFSGKYTYGELRETIKTAILSLQENDNLYISSDDLNYVFEGYDQWIQQNTNDGPISERLYIKSDSKKLTLKYFRFRERCYNKLLDKVSFRVKESIFKKSK